MDRQTRVLLLILLLAGMVACVIPVPEPTSTIINTPTTTPSSLVTGGVATGIITGVLIDDETEMPLFDYFILLAVPQRDEGNSITGYTIYYGADGKPQYHTETDKNGYFIITNIEPGEYEICLYRSSAYVSMGPCNPVSLNMGEGIIGIVFGVEAGQTYNFGEIFVK